MMRLIEEFAKMPGVGIRTAERFAMYILSAPAESVEALSQMALKVNGHIHACQECFNLSEAPICRICSDPTRDHAFLCVVQDPKDVIAIEKSGDFRGVYHVLLGALSPLEGIGPKDIKIKELLDRLKKGLIKEVVLGTSSDTEGDATSLYILKQIHALAAKGGKVKVTRIAHGVPVGSALEFVDKATLTRAFKQRQEVF
jgi:recombination protein RecR